MGADAVVARAALHFDEEPIISGCGGSGAVFFSGCALHCRFCQNRRVSHEGFGRRVSVEGLRNIYADLISQGADNINLVTPSHFVEPILQSLEGGLPVPVVWNSGGYERVETVKRLEGHVSVYLPDLKYRWPSAADRYSKAADYFENASGAIREMLRQTGPVELDENGLIQRGVVVRHLILPGHARESMDVLDWIKENLPGAWVSLMAQYVPLGDLMPFGTLRRRITQREYDAVVNHMFSLGIEDGFVQELSSADEKYIPDFDLTGVPDCFT
jgi:putative pyruvate formate lyase activating enzyme